MPTHNRLLFSLANRQFYESLSRYPVDETHFVNLAQRCVPIGWELRRNDVWMHCSSTDAYHPAQGWKIHVSAAITDARAILRTVVPVLVRWNVPFKFAADGHLLRMMTSKRWPRGMAGKFMTAYPASEEQFVKLMKELDAVLRGFSGPHILSDTRYGNNPVLYYRYGGLSRTKALMVNGGYKAVIIAGDGSAYHDQRLPYANNPEWVKDPLADTPGDTGKPVLKDGRYEVISALSFSTSGGVYKAIDTKNGQTVVIKEARPLTNVQRSGADAVALLKKEHRLLTTLSGTCIAPEPIDFFREWEHCFLVQEYFDGEPLRYWANKQSLALRTRPATSDVRRFYEWFRDTYCRASRLFEVLHQHRIVFGDVSHYNLLVRASDAEMRLIDFEAAYEDGVDEPTPLFTPGFSPSEGSDQLTAQCEDDYFGLGALMLAGLMPINALMYVKPAAHQVFAKALVHDLGLPDTVERAILGLMSRDRQSRLLPARARSVLSEEASCRDVAISTAESEQVDQDLLDRIADYTLAFADYDRTDRLFPSDSEVFSTNPLSVAYGACGIAYAIHRLTARVPEPVLDWIRSQNPHPETYPPGLYLGLSGIAWVHLELGLTEYAEKLTHIADQHPLLWDCPDLFYGAAGWGLTSLKFFLRLGNEWFLERAVAAGEHLLRIAQRDDHGHYWPSQGEIYYGLGHGASGVALFLLYLYLVTQREDFLEAGRQGIEYELSRAILTQDGGLTWPIHEGHVTSAPYLRYGGAGVGMSLLRYWGVTGEPAYRDALDQIAIDADRKYAIFPGHSFGLSGLGEFFLDMAQFTGERKYLDSARKVAAGVMLFAIDAPEGIAFPGEELLRISCDYATGSAGVGVFLERLLSRRPACFVADEAFQGAFDQPAESLVFAHK
jgi:serine/threonine protein kinase